MSDDAADVVAARQLLSSGAAGSSVMSSAPGFISGTTSRATAPMATSGTARMTTSEAGTASACSATWHAALAQVLEAPGRDLEVMDACRRS